VHHAEPGDAFELVDVQLKSKSIVRKLKHLLNLPHRDKLL
jgi:hypothetical protein